MAWYIFVTHKWCTLSDLIKSEFRLGLYSLDSIRFDFFVWVDVNLTRFDPTDINVCRDFTVFSRVVWYTFLYYSRALCWYWLIGFNRDTIIRLINVLDCSLYRGLFRISNFHIISLVPIYGAYMIFLGIFGHCMMGILINLTVLSHVMDVVYSNFWTIEYLMASLHLRLWFISRSGFDGT